MTDHENIQWFLQLSPSERYRLRYGRPEGVQGSERLLVREPRSGSQPDGAEKRSGEDSGVRKTVEQRQCMRSHSPEGFRGFTCGYTGQFVHDRCLACTGQRSGLPND